MRIVLNWGDAVKDLDLFSMYRPSKSISCVVFFGTPACSGSVFQTVHNNFGNIGGESLTFNRLGKFNYTFAVNNFIDTSGGVIKGEFNEQTNSYNSDVEIVVKETKIEDSRGRISFISPNYEFPLLELKVPTSINEFNTVEPYNKDEKYKWWILFCLDGSKGINELKVVNKFSSKQPTSIFCDELGKHTKNSFLETSQQK